MSEQELELERLRLENAFLRQRLVVQPPKYMSGRWLRQSGANIQEQIPLNPCDRG